MFGAGRFDLMRFNVRRETGDDVRLVVSMAALWRAMAGSGENVHEDLSAHEAMAARAEMGAGTLLSFSLAAAAGMRAEVRKVVPVEGTYRIRFENRTEVASESFPRIDFGIDVEGLASLGLDALMALALAGRLESAVWPAGDWHLPQTLCGVVFGAQIDPRTGRAEQAVFDITIAPGDVLEIDSEQYTVTLNGENVLDKQAGVWLWLDRMVTDVRLEADAGRVSDLAVELRYAEKWL